MPDSRLAVLVCLLLAFATIAAYWPVRHCDFVIYDDPAHVTDNHRVRDGLTWEGMAWAFRGSASAEWQPMTLVSHMLDCELYGLKSAGHHLTNLFFHVANALLLFLVLRRMTGATWRSVLVAALFALHPLHVESVAWIAERKDVLSTFFFLLALWSYARYVGESNVQRPKSKVFYVLSLALFALGLMSKPMVVTLPFLLLLLDFWPLGRFQPSTLSFQRSTLWRLLGEKFPFFVLATAASVVTFLVARASGATPSFGVIPTHVRLLNGLVSYMKYLEQTAWPNHLAAFYPYPKAFPAFQIVISLVILVGATVAALWLWRRAPYVAVGWFWFVGTLVPVIGLVQAGGQAMADRFTYIPLIGVFVVLAWGGSDLLIRWRLLRSIGYFVAPLILVAFALRTTDQVGYWRNTETLFRHDIEVTGGNYVACSLLAVEMTRQGKPDEAMKFWTEALRFNPGYAEAHYNVGVMLEHQGKLDEAIGCYTAALQSDPRYTEAYNNLGILLRRRGKLDQAAAAITEALRIKPANAEAHYNLGLVFALNGQPAEAVTRYREAIRLRPDYAKALNNLAWLRATCRDPLVRDGGEAVRLAKRAVDFTGCNDAPSLDTLAAAYAEAGLFSNSVHTARQAIDLAEAAGQKELVAEIRRRISDYASGKPYRE